MGISPFNHEAKILFHTDFYFYLDTLQKLQDNVSEEDLESLSEMACDDEVALFLSRDAKSQYNFFAFNQIQFELANQRIDSLHFVQHDAYGFFFIQR